MSVERSPALLVSQPAIAVSVPRPGATLMVVAEALVIGGARLLLPIAAGAAVLNECAPTLAIAVLPLLGSDVVIGTQPSRRVTSLPLATPPLRVSPAAACWCISRGGSHGRGESTSCTRAFRTAVEA